MRSTQRILLGIALAALMVAVDWAWLIGMGSPTAGCETCRPDKTWDVVQRGIACVGIPLSWGALLLFVTGWRKEAGHVALGTLGVAIMWLVVFVLGGGASAG